ncbi:MAG: Dyp-type peroxidase [Deltaproteobacteria bacterium]|nr:Dyp-type peroxidase [Deltaproteobacteria bacterium]
MPKSAESSQRVLSPPPASARFLTLRLVDGGDHGEALRVLARHTDSSAVVGVGAPLVDRLGRAVPGLAPFPAELAPLMPATQGALWLALLHDDRGDQLDASLRLTDLVAGAFAIDEEIDAFSYRGGRDLSGFVDGTANPSGDDAVAAAIVAGRGPGLDGGSFVSVQRWLHDLAAIAGMPEVARDHVIGRRLVDDEELADAPASAHVKRTAQEEFDPEAFVVRRSMPWGTAREHGLYFVAYGESLERFTRLARRMVGRDDGIVDALFSFSRAVTGAMYFCPPVIDGRIDLRALGL